MNRKASAGSRFAACEAGYILAMVPVTMDNNMEITKMSMRQDAVKSVVESIGITMRANAVPRRYPTSPPNRLSMIPSRKIIFRIIDR